MVEELTWLTNVPTVEGKWELRYLPDLLFTGNGEHREINNDEQRKT